MLLHPPYIASKDATYYYAVLRMACGQKSLIMGANARKGGFFMGILKGW